MKYEDLDKPIRLDINIDFPNTPMAMNFLCFLEKLQRIADSGKSEIVGLSVDRSNLKIEVHPEQAPPSKVLKVEVGKVRVLRGSRPELEPTALVSHGDAVG